MPLILTAVAPVNPTPEITTDVAGKPTAGVNEVTEGDTPSAIVINLLAVQPFASVTVYV